MDDDHRIRGRGSTANPTGRFERLEYVADAVDDGPRRPATEFFKDHSRRVITRNTSPDIGFEFSVNPYRGCEHGCAYCYARPYHEYLGMSAGLDFETKILVKQDAAERLRQELGARRWKPAPLVLSGVTDPYQPIERRLAITRRCLEVICDFRNPVYIVTKNHLVCRDADLLGGLARDAAVAVFVSVTTLDPLLARHLEPRTSTPARRLEAVRTMAAAGIPTGILVAPVIPGLTDHEIPSILEAGARAGARHAGYTLLRLPHGVASLFEGWLRAYRPEQADKVLNRVRAMRDGQLNESRFGKRLRGTGPFADQIEAMFRMARRRHGLEGRRVELSTSAFRRPDGDGKSPRDRRAMDPPSLFD